MEPEYMIINEGPYGPGPTWTWGHMDLALEKLIDEVHMSPGQYVPNLARGHLDL